MDESARVLDENPEWLGDRVLVLQAKLQLVMEQCTQADRLAQEDGVRVSAMGARYHEALAARIGEIERSISPELRQLSKFEPSALPWPSIFPCHAYLLTLLPRFCRRAVEHSQAVGRGCVCV